MAKGFRQREGIEYKDLFSPTVRFESIILLLAIASKEALFLTHFDVTTAFLHAEFEEEIYIPQPRGFEDGTGRVCRLKKALYGLRQAPRAWNKKLTSCLRQLGLIPCDSDQSVFVSGPPHRLLVAIYVDDGLTAGESQEVVDNFLRELGKTFKVTSKRLEYFLGIHINVSQDRLRIQINQSKYIDELLAKFQMTKCKPAPTPMTADPSRSGWSPAVQRNRR